jgi:AcrR family transcriptional regulator
MRIPLRISTEALQRHMSSIVEVGENRKPAPERCSGSPNDGKHASERPERPQFQRARLLRAAVKVAAERGYERMTVAAIVARAGVSRKTFYELFKDRDDCFLAVVEEALLQMTRVVAPQYGRDGGWPERLRDALGAALEFLEREPDTCTLALSYLRGAGPRRSEPRDRALRILRRVVEDGARHAKHCHELSPVTAEVMVGGALAVVHTRLESRETDLTGVLNPLMSTVVLPYVGKAAAGEQLTYESPSPADSGSRPHRDPEKDLGIRLTYRTARALAVIAASPDLSNLEVGRRAGISDQGQISKLLSRLGRLGLIENTGLGKARGAANAWRLTPAGREVEVAIHHVTSSTSR